jgi:deferrochelatase/peroxidase EfeB
MQLSNVDFDDIQGLVRFGHGQLKEARFFLLKVADADAARLWLAAAPVTTAVDSKALDPTRLTDPPKRKRPDSALQVAFTYEGLEALGASQEILDGFSVEFTGGMAEESRSRRLGDVGLNDPKHWEWGQPGEAPHVLVLVYATAGRFASWTAEVKGKFWDAAFTELPCLSTHDIGDIEPFGFADGISQPELDWERRKPTRLRDIREYTNAAALGEFLLGYPNEYGKYTDRPLLDPGDDPQRILPLAEDVPGKKDFGRNGTYLVVRDLSQDVAGFWQYVDEQAQHDRGKREELAHAMVGRMRSGDPIVPLHGRPIEGVAYHTDETKRLKDLWLNQFTFDNDPDGTACPFGAHIRRTNPRNADLPAGTRGPISRLMRILGFCAKGSRDDLTASTRFHRILRRGREYGPELKPEQAVKGEPERQARGLRFICLNANISRQFEFIQTSWIANAKFVGVDEGDPLLGNREPLWTGGSTDTFARPRNSGLCDRVGGLQQFVTVRGGAYFFMPGISALHYLACTSRRGY